MNRARWIIVLIVAAVAVGLAAWAQLGAHRAPAIAGFKVVAAYPHDPSAFIEGLVIHAGEMYESTGQYGTSALRRVDLATGRIEKQRALSEAYFGEGITVFGDKIYQLTYKTEVAFVYDLATFNVQQTLQYSGEGWGLTHDGVNLIMSNGSSSLRYLDPQTLALVKELPVHDGEQPIERLNELEYIDGEIWSNIWYEDRIVRISPATGEVLGWIDLSSLYPKTARGSEDVLNGIAYDAATKRVYVTGKNWPQLFQIEVVPR